MEIQGRFRFLWAPQKIASFGHWVVLGDVGPSLLSGRELRRQPHCPWQILSVLSPDPGNGEIE